MTATGTGTGLYQNSGEPMTTPHDIIERTDAPLAPRMPALPIAQLLQQAIEKGVSADSLEKMVTLAERIQDRNAREEFAAAMAGFQGECPPIPHNKEAKFPTRGGHEMRYTYADLNQINIVARPIANKYGLSWTWDTEYANNRMVVTCIVSHVNGHSTRTSTSRTTDSNSAASSQQKDSMAETTGQRRSLIGALGLTTCDEDRDGGDDNPTPISEHQAANLDAMIDEAKANRDKFLTHFRIERVADLPLARHAEAVTLLEAKRKAGGRG